MAKRSAADAGDSKIGAIPSLIASLALIRAARRSPTWPDQERSVRQRLEAATEPTEPTSRARRGLWRADRFQRSHSWAGYPYAVVRKFGQDQAGSLAALVAYYGLFSIFPLMLAFMSVIGFIVPNPDDQKRFADAVANQIPIVGGTIRDTAGTLNGSVVGITIGLLVALWSGLKIIDSMQNALNSVWDIPRVERPNFVKLRLKSLLMLTVIGGGLVASVAVTSVAANLDIIPGGGKFGISAGSLAVSIGIYWLAFRLLTDRPLPWMDLLPGAIFGGVCWWALQTWGNVYLSRQQQAADRRYGQFAQIILLMTFLFLLAQLSILGAEIAVVRSRRLWPRSLSKGSYTDADVRVFEAAADSSKLDKGYNVVLVPSESVDIATETTATQATDAKPTDNKTTDNKTTDTKTTDNTSTDAGAETARG